MSAPDVEGLESMVSEDKLASTLARLRAEYPQSRFFQIVIPDREDDLFIARKASWTEYKKILGAVNSQGEANEVLLQLFLVHPKPDYAALATDVEFWTPGLVVELARCIQRGLGFGSGGALKNL